MDAGGRDDKVVCGGVALCHVSSSGPTIGDTIGDVCLSQAEISRSLE